MKEITAYQSTNGSIHAQRHEAVEHDLAKIIDEIKSESGIGASLTVAGFLVRRRAEIIELLRSADASTVDRTYDKRAG